MTSEAPRIALIHATSAAVGPATAAISAESPGATLWNILDDRLQADAAEPGFDRDAQLVRMRRLVSHAAGGGADAVLLTCSLYGWTASPLRDELGLPVFPPDGAAVEDLIASGAERVLVVASNEASRADSVARLAAAAGPSVDVVGTSAAGAAEAAAAGDRSALLAALGTAVAAHEGADAVLLAQYSLSPARAELSERTGLPVFAGPASAAAGLAAVLRDGSSA